MKPANYLPESQELESLTGRNFPPTAPPPEMSPPPPYSPNWTDHIYEAIEPSARHRWLFRIALCEFLLGASALTAALVCVIETNYCPLYSGAWVAPIYILNSIIGIVAAKQGSVNFFVAHLVLCVLSLVGSVILVGTSVRNWLAIGVYHEDNPVYCALDAHDHKRMLEIYEEQTEFDFGRCVLELKLGLSLNSLLVFFGAIEGFLTIVSGIMCCRRVCHCEKCFH